MYVTISNNNTINIYGLAKNKAAVIFFEEPGISVFLTIVRFPKSSKNKKGRIVVINFELVKSHSSLSADYIFLH